MDFNTEKKGFNRLEVNEYINKLSAAYENVLAEQKQRIFDLKRELTACEKNLEHYRAERTAVSKALESAVAKAEEIDRLSQKKYKEEMEQLRAFHDKWLSYYDKLLKKYPLDDELLSVAGFNRSMEKILSNAGLAGEQYLKERERLEGEQQIGYVRVQTHGEDKVSDEDVLKQMLPDLPDGTLASADYNPLERVKDYLNRRDTHQTKQHKKEEDEQVSDSGFSFEEALNPKQDLTEIMRELGLYED